VAEPAGSAVILGVLVAYLVILLVIGFWSSRASRDIKGYFVAGKRLPAWVIAFSSNATGESGWLLLGLTGMGYLMGFHALWVTVGEVLGVAVAWIWVGRPFKEYTDRYDSITVPDYLESRLRDSRHILRLIGVAIILSMVMAYTAAQLTASGKAFSSFLGTSYTAGVLIGAIIVLVYTSIGGFKAVAYSDLVQGVLMFGCLFTLPIVGTLAAGGWTGMTDALRAADPALLAPMGSFGLTPAGIASAAGFVGVGLAFLGSPQLLTRFMSARSQAEIVRGSPLAVVCILVFDLGAVLSGIAGRVIFPGLADHETILPQMSSALFPDFFTGIFLVVVLAAIMSTADSLLILASSALTRDIVQKIFHPRISERGLSILGQLTTLAIGAGALVFALAEVRMIFWFVLFAWSGLACAFTPVVLCTLFWRRTTLPGAVAGMLGGFVTAVIWILGIKEEFYDLYEMIPGFLVSFVLIVAVSLFTRPPADAAAEFDAVHRAVGPALRPRPDRVG
jgi:sodium/proline symporter